MNYSYDKEMAFNLISRVVTAFERLCYVIRVKNSICEPVLSVTNEKTICDRKDTNQRTSTGVTKLLTIAINSMTNSLD